MDQFTDILSYPYDSEFLFRKAKSIRKDLLLKEDLKPIRIAILGGSTTSHIKTFLELFLLKKGIRPLFWESEYSQYYVDAVHGNESLSEFKPQVSIVYTSAINIQSALNLSHSFEQRDHLIVEEAAKIAEIWQGLKNSTESVIIQNNFEYPQHRVLGNLEGSHPGGIISFIRGLNQKISEMIFKEKSIYLNDMNYLSSLVGLDAWHDPEWWYLYKYASSLKSFPYIAESLSALVQAILGLSKKNLILDLDNTVWGGVIGDDGVDGIHISPETAIGESFTAFQKYCKAHKERGVVLSVCSKNDFSNAEQGFQKQDSILRMNDFASFKANWERKDQNIHEMSLDLSLGIDSFVFIDDNPTERSIVRKSLPHVVVPEVGSDVSHFATIIDRGYYFEPLSLSEDDTRRSQMYEQNAQRLNTAYKFSDYGEYLSSLGMEAEILPFKVKYLERITQLINKTNQFNVTTKRMTLEEVSRRSSSDQSIQLYGRLKDRFGDNGLVSLMMGEISGETVSIDLWLMSCRVLKKDFEKAMLDSFVSLAKQRHLTSITGYFEATEKNKMVQDLYAQMGFSLVASEGNKTFWKLDLNNYKPQNLYIRINS